MTETTNAAPKSTGAIIGIIAVALVVLVAISAIGGNIAAAIMGPAEANSEEGPVAAQENTVAQGEAAQGEAAEDAVAQVDGNAVAAVVNGQSIPELTITNYIADFRADMGLEDDAAWGEWMAMYGYTPETVRQEVIEGFVQDALLSLAAEELQVEVTQQDVDEALARAKADFESDEEYQEALAQDGLTEETLIQTILVPNILWEKVGKAAVGDKLETDENAFNEWLENYRQQKGVVVNEMPAGLPYVIDMAAYEAAAANGELDLGDDELTFEDEDGNEISMEDLEMLEEDAEGADAEGEELNLDDLIVEE